MGAKVELKLGEAPPGYKSGFVAVVGLPNAGKSTLINALLGREATITSPKPQTTRYRIRCVSTDARRQMIFVDTPGWLKDKRRIDRAMRDEILKGLDGVDVVLAVVDGTRPELGILGSVLARLGPEAGGAPVVAVLSKIDKVGKSGMIPLLTKVSEALAPRELVPVSSLEKDNLGELDRVLTALLPEGPVLFPPDLTTDRPPAFMCAELIREQIFHMTREEVPYSTAVEIEAFEDRDGEVRVAAVIWVDRDSQKGILIGAGGKTLAEIRRKAVPRMRVALGAKTVELALHVKVAEGWRDNEHRLRELGLGVDD